MKLCNIMLWNVVNVNTDKVQTLLKQSKNAWLSASAYKALL